MIVDSLPSQPSTDMNFLRIVCRSSRFKAHRKAAAHTQARRCALSSIHEGLDEIAQQEMENRLLVAVDANLSACAEELASCTAELRTEAGSLTCATHSESTLDITIMSTYMISSLSRQIRHLAYWQSDLLAHRQAILGCAPRRASNVRPVAMSSLRMPVKSDYCWDD